MLFFTIYSLIYTLSSSVTYGLQTTNCPLIKLQTNPMVNLTEYTRASWYVQQQQLTGYQPLEDLYCVTATYDSNNDTDVPFFSGNVISVYNYANQGKVNGPSMGNYTPGTKHNFRQLCARELNQSEPEKLEVAPCFLPNLFDGAYWILEAGPTTTNYDWAIVIGGQPTKRIDNSSCTTSDTGINGSGLWLFSRNQTLTDPVIRYLHRVLYLHNISTTLLHNVTQTGCNYSGAFLKH